MLQKNLDFNISNEVFYLVFGMPNAKSLALGALDVNALTCMLIFMRSDLG